MVIDERQERGEDEEHFGFSLQNCRKLVAQTLSGAGWHGNEDIAGAAGLGVDQSERGAELFLRFEIRVTEPLPQAAPKSRGVHDEMSGVIERQKFDFRF